MKVNNLQRELEGVRTLLKNMKDVEEKNQKTIQTLNEACKEMDEKLKEEKNMTTGKANEINDWISRKEDAEAKKNDLLSFKNQLVEEVQEYQQDADENERAKKHLQEELVRLTEELKQAEEKYHKEDELKRQNQEDVENLLKEKDQLESEMENDQEVLKEERDEITRIKANISEHSRSLNITEQKIERLQKEKLESKKKVSDYQTLIEKLEKDNHDKEVEFHKLKMELEKINNDIERESMDYDHKNEISKKLKEEKDQIIVEKNKLKDTIYHLERELDEQVKIANEDDKAIKDLNRDQNTLRNKISKAKKINEEQDNEKQKTIKEKEKLAREEVALKKEIEFYNQEIKRLDDENKKRMDECSGANAKFFHLLDEIKLKDNLINEFQKKNLEIESRLKQQQTLYETVRSDRNLYCKKYAETKEEMVEIDRKYKEVGQQITKLKEEIKIKELSMNQVYEQSKSLENKCTHHQKSIDEEKKSNQQKAETIGKFMDLIAKLKNIIKESERQRGKLKEQYEMVVSERDILSMQLIKREKEVKLRDREIRVQQSTLKKGENQYLQKLASIKSLKSTIIDLMEQLKTFEKHVNEIPDLKRDVQRLHKELIEEKLKVKALSEELENPMNVHRWRKLEGTESESFEMITKIHTLQK